MNRRSFLASMLAAGAAPYVMSGGIGRGVLMPVREIVIPKQEIIVALGDWTVESFGEFGEATLTMPLTMRVRG